MKDRTPPDTNSGRGRDCPICGRTKDGDCRFSSDMVFCHHGSSLAPPTGLTPGDVITGADGRPWAYVSTGDGASGTCSTFVLHEELPEKPARNRRTVKQRKPAKPKPLSLPTEPITLAALTGAELMDGAKFSEKKEDTPGTLLLQYADGLTTKRVPKVGKDGRPDKDFFPHHLNGSSPVLTRGAGPSPWPLWHQADLSHVRPGEWILETEGEGCANHARLGGVVSISQPGHARSVQQRTDRYAAVVQSGAGGIIYLADHDDPGRKYAADAQQAAAIAGLPIVVVHAGELHEQMPAGGSIDDLCRPADHKKPGLAIPPAAAIELILEHARTQQQSPDTHEAEEPRWSDDFPPASTAADELIKDDEEDDELFSAAEMLDISERLAEGRKMFTLAGLLPPDLAAAVEILHKPLPTDDLSAALALLTGYSGLLKLGTRVASSVSYSVPANLYAAMVMPSGGAKSPVKATLVDNPAKGIRKECQREHERAMANWTMETQGVKQADRPPAPKPVFPHLSKYSPASLARQLQLHEKKGLGLLLIRDEMSAMLKALVADTEHGSGDADGQLLEAFDGSGSTQILIGKDGAGEVRTYEECHLSVFGNVQPGVLKELINGSDPIGKFARFLFCRIPRKPLILQDNDPTDEEWDRHEAAEAMLEAYAIKLFSMPPRKYRICQEARQRFNPWFRKYQERALLPGTPDVIGALLGKSSAHALRLAGVLHVVQIAAGLIEHDAHISAGTLDNAMAIVDQLLAETEAFHEHEETDTSLLMQFIHQLSWDTGKPVTLRIAKDKGTRLIRRILNADSFKAAALQLQHSRYGETSTGKTTSGRSSGLAYSATREMQVQ